MQRGNSVLRCIGRNRFPKKLSLPDGSMVYLALCVLSFSSKIWLIFLSAGFCGYLFF